MKTALIIMFLMLMSIVGFSQESPIWTDSLKVKLNGTYTNITPTLESLTSGNIDSALSILYVPDTTISPGDFTRTGHLSTRIYTALKRQAMIDFLAMNWGYVTPAMFQHPDVPYAPSAYGGNADSNTVYMQRAIQRAASLRTRLWNVKTWEGWKMDFNPQAEDTVMFQMQNGMHYTGSGSASDGGVLAEMFINKVAGIDTVTVFSSDARAYGGSGGGLQGSVFENISIFFDTTGQGSGNGYKNTTAFEVFSPNDNAIIRNFRSGGAVADSLRGVIHLYGGNTGICQLEDIFLFFHKDSTTQLNKHGIVIGKPYSGGSGALTSLNIKGTYKADAAKSMLYFWERPLGTWIENLVWERQGQFGGQNAECSIVVFDMTDAGWDGGSQTVMNFGNIMIQSNETNGAYYGGRSNMIANLFDIRIPSGEFTDVPALITVESAFLNLFDYIVRDRSPNNYVGNYPTWTTETILSDFTIGAENVSRFPLYNYSQGGFAMFADKDNGVSGTDVKQMRFNRADTLAEGNRLWIQTIDPATGNTERYYLTRDSLDYVRPEWWGAVPSDAQTYNSVNSTAAFTSAMAWRGRGNIRLDKGVYWVDSLIVRQGSRIVGSGHEAGTGGVGTRISPVPGSTAKYFVQTGDVNAGDDSDMHGTSMENLAIDGNQTVTDQVGLKWGGNGFNNYLRNMLIGSFDSLGVVFSSTPSEMTYTDGLWLGDNDDGDMRVEGAGSYVHRMLKFDLGSNGYMISHQKTPDVRTSPDIYQYIRAEGTGAGNLIDINSPQPMIFGTINMATVSAGTTNDSALISINKSLSYMDVYIQRINQSAVTDTAARYLVRDHDGELALKGAQLADFEIRRPFVSDGTLSHRYMTNSQPSRFSVGRLATSTGNEAGSFDIRGTNSSFDGVLARLRGQASATNATSGDLFLDVMDTGTLTNYIAIYGASDAMQFPLGFTGVEQSAPTTPATNAARVYFQDDGSGNTLFLVKFANGDVDTLATSVAP